YELFWMKHHFYRVFCVLPRARPGEPGQFPVILCLVLVNKDLDDVRVCHQLAGDEAHRCLVGAHAVFLFAARHPERHHDITLPLLDQLLASDGEVLDTRDGDSLDADTRMLLQFINGNAPHVHPCKRGIGHANFHPSTPAAAITPSSFAAYPCALRAYWTAARVARTSGALTAPMLPIRKIFPFRWSCPPAISIPIFLTVPRKSASSIPGGSVIAVAVLE